MHVELDRSRCVGGAHCVLSAPEVFEQDDDEGTAFVVISEPSPELWDGVREAAHRCPVRGITVTE